MSEEVLAGSDAASLENAVQTEASNEAAQEGENTENGTDKQKTGNPKVDDPWPESARNKVNRLNKQLAQRQASERAAMRRLAEYEAKLAEFEARTKTPENKEPNEDDFENYGDYLKAVAKYRPPEKQAGQQEADPKKLQEQALQQARQQAHYEQRRQVVGEVAQKAMQEHPEIQQLATEYEDVLDALPEHLDMMFLDLDNAPAAFYALAKDGNLENTIQRLSYMTPGQAAIEIARAQMRGEQMLQATKVSKTPSPIQGARGISSTGKSLETMSGKELRKKYGV